MAFVTDWFASWLHPLSGLASELARRFSSAPFLLLVTAVATFASRSKTPRRDDAILVGSAAFGLGMSMAPLLLLSGAAPIDYLFVAFTTIILTLAMMPAHRPLLARFSKASFHVLVVAPIPGLLLLLWAGPVTEEWEWVEEWPRVYCFASLVFPLVFTVALGLRSRKRLNAMWKWWMSKEEEESQAPGPAHVSLIRHEIVCVRKRLRGKLPRGRKTSMDLTSP